MRTPSGDTMGSTCKGAQRHNSNILTNACFKGCIGQRPTDSRDHHQILSDWCLASRHTPVPLARLRPALADELKQEPDILTFHAGLSIYSPAHMGGLCSEHSSQLCAGSSDQDPKTWSLRSGPEFSKTPTLCALQIGPAGLEPRELNQ